MGSPALLSQHEAGIPLGPHWQLLSARPKCSRREKSKMIFTPKKLLLIGAGVLILFIGVLIGASNKNPSSFQSVSPSPGKQSIGYNSSNNNELFRVARVIDGDTIELGNGERVRYIGIDTPETVDPRKPVQCFGVEASKKNKELVEGKSVRLEKDITDRDKYNRLLRYVWIGDTFVNLELVKQGFAQSYSYPPDIKYQDQFVGAQKEARETKTGLWGACPAVTGTTVAPLPMQTGNATSGSCVIKGNISSSGEKIYHLPGCGSYVKTQVDEARGERWFCSESEAQSSGWRRALNCN